MCAFVKASADIPSSEGDLKVLEAGYILISSASTLRIDKRRAYCLFPLEGGTWIRAISWRLEGRALSGPARADNLDNSLGAPVLLRSPNFSVRNLVISAYRLLPWVLSLYLYKPEKLVGDNLVWVLLLV